MTNPADRYRQLAERFSAVLADVPRGRWDAASPCEGWTTRDVVAHVADTQLALVDRLGLRSDDDRLPPDPIERWGAVRDLVQALLDDPTTAAHTYDGHVGPTTFGETIDRFYCFDLVIHAWDVARAAGLDHHEPIDPAEIGRVRADAESMGDALRSPGICGPAVATVGPTTEQDALLAFLGRRP